MWRISASVTYQPYSAENLSLGYISSSEKSHICINIFTNDAAMKEHFERIHPDREEHAVLHTLLSLSNYQKPITFYNQQGSLM